jgi:hypothetical protein
VSIDALFTVPFFVAMGVLGTVFSAVIRGEAHLVETMPWRLASLARVPLRREGWIALTPRAARALARAAVEPVGYREPAQGAIDLGKLDAPQVVTDARGLLFFDLGRGLVVARGTRMSGRNPWPLVRVDVRTEADRLVLRAAYYAPGMLGLLAFGLAVALLFLCVAPPPWLSSRAALFGMLVFTIGNAVLAHVSSYRSAGTVFAMAFAELEARVRGLEAAPEIRARVEDVSALPPIEADGRADQRWASRPRG